MHRPLVIGLLLVGVFFGILETPARSAPPWASLIPFRRIEADPLNWYELTEDQGPWMILAASFRGPQAQRQAHELVLELRKEFKLPAYLHARQFDFTQRERGLGFTENGRPKVMRYQNAEKVVDVAVLVGDFHSVEDPRAQRTLEIIKYARPECLKRTHRTSQELAEYRDAQRAIHRFLLKDEKKTIGPMRAAFVTPNPMLPQEAIMPQGLDPLVVEMNRDVPFSLLDCRGAYSVKVATFRGLSTMKLPEIDALESGVNTNSTLIHAAENAHQMAIELRERGVEAYEFYDRHESVVTVGSFQSVGQPRRDGKIEINPAVHQVMQAYGAQRAQLRGMAQAGMVPRELPVTMPDGAKTNLKFDIQPMPIKVPRASLASSYANRNLFR